MDSSEAAQFESNQKCWTLAFTAGLWAADEQK